MANKNNPLGNRRHTGALIDREVVVQFDEILKCKCLKKTSVIRKLVTDFVSNDGFAGEVSDV